LGPAVFVAHRILGVIEEQAFIQRETLLVRTVSMPVRMTR